MIHGHYKTKLDNPGSRSFSHSKSKALEYFKSKKYKKKAPTLPLQEDKPSAYKKMSIDEWEKKYL